MEKYIAVIDIKESNDHNPSCHSQLTFEAIAKTKDSSQNENQFNYQPYFNATVQDLVHNSNPRSYSSGNPFWLTQQDLNKQSYEFLHHVIPVNKDLKRNLKRLVEQHFQNLIKNSFN